MSVPAPAMGHPQRVILDGRYVRLELLEWRHARDLYRASEPDRFRYVVDAPPANEADLASYVARMSPSDDPLIFAVIDLATGRQRAGKA